MKCPKCEYIGFERTGRCRNCGYDFALTDTGPADSDLPFRGDETAGPMTDLTFRDTTRAAGTAPAPRSARRGADVTTTSGGTAASVPPTATDYPLFEELSTDETPLVRPSGAGAPLAVRRSTPVPAKSRPSATPRPPDRHAGARQPAAAIRGGRPEAAGVVAPDEAAGRAVPGLAARAGAALIDGALLAALDLAIVYFTLRVSRLDLIEVTVLPAAPLLAFIGLLDGCYLVLLTAASGQTFGKMAFGLRVVSGDDRPVGLGQAAVRVIACLLSALPAGLGLLPMAFDRARRGLHDRLARTRVVRVTAAGTSRGATEP